MAIPGKLYREGNILKQENVSEPIKIFFVEQFGFNHFFNDEIFQWIDTLAATGINGMRVFGFWPFGKGYEQEPYPRTGNGYDLNQFNEQYFDYLSRWVAHANDKGIFVLYELFDSCGFWGGEEFARHNPFYQLVGSNHLAFSDLKNPQLVTIQKRYIRKVIETIRPNQNMIFGIMNEFLGDKSWHYEMSKYVKSLTSDHLTAGSHEPSPAADDPNVDIWFVHKGSYNVQTGSSNVAKDIQELRQRAGNQKVLGYSTDGFGSAGKARENPVDMSRLALEVQQNALQLFGFLDHYAYKEGLGYYPSSVHQLNVETYQAIVAQYPPTGTSPIVIELPEGFFDVFVVSKLPSTHPGAFVERGGKAIRATTEQGFLCYGQYKTGYPIKPLKALFSILADNNTADDRYILILDVYDHHSDRVLGKEVITRKDFTSVNNFSLFEFDFTPPSEEARMEFRVYYMGYSYILADKIAVIDPDKVTVNDASEIPNPIYIPPTPTPTPTPGPGPEVPGTLVLDDPLTTGKSVGKVAGGSFTAEGYNVATNSGGYIVYDTNVVGNIKIEFDAKGYLDREDYSQNKLVVMQICDAHSDTPWNNETSVSNAWYEIRKRGIVPDYDSVTNCLAFKCGKGDPYDGSRWLELGSWNAGQAAFYGPAEWNSNTVYHWEITVRNGFTEIIRNGQTMYSVACSQFAPTGKLCVRIGGTHWGRGGPRNVTYSNVKIYQL